MCFGMLLHGRRYMSPEPLDTKSSFFAFVEKPRRDKELLL